jgi:hypothetical protein
MPEVLRRQWLFMVEYSSAHSESTGAEGHGVGEMTEDNRELVYDKNRD